MPIKLIASLIAGGVDAARDRRGKLLSQVISDNSAGMVLVEHTGQVIAASRVAATLLTDGQAIEGRQADDVLPADMRTAVRQVLESGVDQTELAIAVLNHGGAAGEDRLVVQYSVTASEVNGGRDRVACVNFWDITARRRDEERLAFLATHDALTGALSYGGLTAAIKERFESERARKEGLVVMLIDLARFKQVNEALGQQAGDMLLKQVVSRLRATGASYVARLGGHEFALAHPGLSTDEAGEFCDLITERLVAPYQLGPHRVLIGIDIGFSHSGISGFDPEQMLSHAEMALTVARQGASRGYAVFSPEMDEQLRARQELETELQRAMERGEISLMYQPQASLADGRIVGVEALMRGMHPRLGAVGPDRFIPVAEETGKIVELGRWILEAACREVASWPGQLRLGVNVSPIQFELVDVVAEIRDTLGRTGFPADRFDVEITEGVFVSNERPVIAALQRLRDLGCGIALDDFGTGYSSLSYLGRLPVDKIKIDQSFVRRLPGDQQAGAIVRAVMMLGEALGKTVLAEGIETADQAWMLKMLKCEIGQGYHFGRPMTGAEMRALLAAEQARNAAAASA